MWHIIISVSASILDCKLCFLSMTSVLVLVKRQKRQKLYHFIGGYLVLVSINSNILALFCLQCKRRGISSSVQYCTIGVQVRIVKTSLRNGCMLLRYIKYIDTGDGFNNDVGIRRYAKSHSFCSRKIWIYPDQDWRSTAFHDFVKLKFSVNDRYTLYVYVRAYLNEVNSNLQAELKNFIFSLYV